MMMATRVAWWWPEGERSRRARGDEDPRPRSATKKKAARAAAAPMGREEIGPGEHAEERSPVRPMRTTRHHVRRWPVSAEGEGGQHVGAEVDGEDLG